MSNPRGFAEWFVKTQPKETVEKLSQLTSKLRLPGPRDRHSGEKEGEGDLAQDSSETQFENQTDIYSFGLHAIMQDTISNIQMSEIEQELTEQPQAMVFRSKLEPGELEPVPNADPTTQEELFYLMERWSIFRMIPKFQKVFNAIESGTFEAMIRESVIPETDEEIEKKKACSLMPYYQTLPKFARENPNVKNVFRGLEFHQPTLSMAEKQKGLNLACKFALPLNPLTNDVCEDIEQSTKTYPSRFDEMKLIQNV